MSAVSPAPMASIVMPAHNEGPIIGRTLRSLLAGAEADLEAGRVEVLVVCNGCTDDTAARAGEVHPAIQVLDAPVASKHAALNYGDERARGPIRLYVDADVEFSRGSVPAVIAALQEPGVNAAAPRIVFDASHGSWGVRQFHRIWQQSPYFLTEVIGSGFFGLSPDARARFDEFPPIIADDLFALALVSQSERRTVQSSTFTPLLPGTLRDMAKVEVRHYAGYEQFKDYWASTGRSFAESVPPHGMRWVARLARSPGNWPGIVIYIGVKAYGKWAGARKYRRGDTQRWERDARGRERVGQA